MLDTIEEASTSFWAPLLIWHMILSSKIRPPSSMHEVQSEESAVYHYLAKLWNDSREEYVQLKRISLFRWHQITWLCVCAAWLDREPPVTSRFCAVFFFAMHITSAVRELVTDLTREKLDVSSTKGACLTEARIESSPEAILALCFFVWPLLPPPCTKVCNFYRTLPAATRKMHTMKRHRRS